MIIWTDYVLMGNAEAAIHAHDAITSTGKISLMFNTTSSTDTYVATSASLLPANARLIAAALIAAADAIDPPPAAPDAQAMELDEVAA